MFHAAEEPDEREEGGISGQSDQAGCDTAIVGISQRVMQQQVLGVVTVDQRIALDEAQLPEERETQRQGGGGEQQKEDAVAAPEFTHAASVARLAELGELSAPSATGTSSPKRHFEQRA